MNTSPPSRHMRCKLCGWVCRGLLPIDYTPDGTMLLNHLSMMHANEVGPYLKRMETEDIDTVAMEAFERIDPPPSH